jgi:L-ascorbate 6-phosphate lactonase
MMAGETAGARQSVPRGSVAITWLRQAGFLIEGPSAAIAIDPFLTTLDGMLVPPFLRPEELGWLDAVLATHEHADHLDLPAWTRLADASARPVFVVAEPLRSLVTDAGIEHGRVIGAQPRHPLELDGVRITPVPALHGVEVADAYDHGRERSGGLDRYLGYVVDFDGVRVYHAGDTLVYDDMAERLRGLDVHVALLPINGRDAEREGRGIVGNMDAAEAAALSVAIGVDLVIPMHYETVPGNIAPVGAFVDEVRRLSIAPSVLVPAHRARTMYTAPTARAMESRRT